MLLGRSNVVRVTKSRNMRRVQNLARRGDEDGFGWGTWRKETTCKS